MTFPDILPGVLSGFMLAFTMSLDDFVITHFTKGPGVDTLSTKIYSEVRKGIKPEMYALSTLLFVTVLVLLILIKRVIPVAICLVFVGGGIYYASKGQMLTKEKLIVYNWGEYMDPDVITLFEEETGIDVVYEEFETNEIMYPKISSGAIAYDLVCPSDYMIQRMRENDSWSVLWDEKYKDNILMQDSVRDAFGVALKYLGYSLNSTDLDELNEAKDLLTRQKPLVQAYVIDQVRDKMIGNEAAIGVIYSGEAIYTQQENSNLEYVIPKEGSNLWIDSWVIPKNAEHKENAEKFINFLCRPDIALMNFEYITYSTPNTAARELIEDESIRNSKIAFPDLSTVPNLETFQYLGTKNDEVYNELWNKVKSK